jgi:DNA invertase Pin-like site-specific DNA recombinase
MYGHKQHPGKSRNMSHFLHAGDTLVVTRIDRLARVMRDLQDIFPEL